MSSIAEGIEVRHSDGIHLPEADLWLDPPRGKGRAFISHAHSDHFARHEWTLCSLPTAGLVMARYGVGKRGTTLAVPFRQPVEAKGFSFELLPAGHILGSAMLHVTRLRDGATLLYTGDFKLRDSRTCERAELLQADTLVMETTFGLPQYVFPAREAVVADMQKFAQLCFDEKTIPVLLGYSLGKAQELIALCAELGHPIMVHDNIRKFNAVFAAHGRPLPEHRVFDASEAAGHLVIAPPHVVGSLRGFSNCRTAMTTGWALMKGARYRFGVDEMFPISDHADHPELLQCVAQTKPRRIFTVHGHTMEFARELRQRGHEAWSPVKDEQRELAI